MPAGCPLCIMAAGACPLVGAVVAAGAAAVSAALTVLMVVTKAEMASK